jgi:hypothetical protein
MNNKVTNASSNLFIRFPRLVWIFFFIPIMLATATGYTWDLTWTQVNGWTTLQMTGSLCVLIAVCINFLVSAFLREHITQVQASAFLLSLLVIVILSFTTTITGDAKTGSFSWNNTSPDFWYQIISLVIHSCYMLLVFAYDKLLPKNS